MTHEASGRTTGADWPPERSPENLPASNGIGRVLAASFIGTTIEAFDFYLYATATALVLGPAFFPKGEPGTQQIEALATFAIAYLARPVGAALFGHFGDRVGRKATLVASLVIMGTSTVLIGCLPTYAMIGWWASAALCLLRCAQGIGFGGEWGGAVLLTVENAPAGKRVLYGATPQLGTTAGVFLANVCLLALSVGLPPDAFQAWGWRVPFLASAVLVGIGLYVRLTLDETPAFKAAMAGARPEHVPMSTLLTRHGRAVLVGTFTAVTLYALVYLFFVFAEGYGAHTLGFPKSTLLLFECIAIGFNVVSVVVSGLASDRFGPRPVLLAGMMAAAMLAFAMGPMLEIKTGLSLLGCLCLGFLVLGWIAGPMGGTLSALFPTRVRYTGTAFSYNLAGILGIAGAPVFTQKLIAVGGIGAVGFYLVAPALLGLVALIGQKGGFRIETAE